MLVLEVPVTDLGEYRIEAVFTKARDYGIVQMHLNSQALGDPTDLFEPYIVMPTRLLELGSLQLPQGTAKLKLEIVGHNPKAAVGHLVGLDYLRLTRIEPPPKQLNSRTVI